MNKNSFLDYVETCEESVSKTRDFVDYVLNFQNPRIKPIITPRFALSCDMNLLKALGKIADEYQLPIQTHVSENLDEISFVKKEFPECKNYVDVYAKAGLITNRVSN